MPARYANSRQLQRRDCTVVVMGGPQGGVQAGTAVVAAGMRMHVDAVDVVERRIAPYAGLSIVERGSLPETQNGRPAGTRFVVIRAESGIERDFARIALEDIGGVDDDAWGRGWHGRRLRGGDVVTELRLYPVAE